MNQSSNIIEVKLHVDSSVHSTIYYSFNYIEI